MTVAICTGAWLRPKLLQLFCEHYSNLKSEFDLDLIVATSEATSHKIVTNNGHISIKHPNTPLWKKMNATLKAAKGYDFVLLIGSDDFVSLDALKFYAEKIRQGYDYIYTLDWYFYDTISKKGLYWAGYNKKFNKGKPCGAGRALSSGLLRKMKYEAWIPGYDKVLDTGMDINIDRHKPNSYAINLKAEGLVCLDVKTETNMTKFEKWDNSKYIIGEVLVKKHFSTLADKILNF